MNCKTPHTGRKYIYVLIRCAQTNVNYFLLKCYRNTTPKEWWLDAQAIQPNVRHHKEKWKILPRKSWTSLADLNFLEALPELALDSFLFFSADNLAFRIFFSSSELEASLSDSYYCTTSHPSLLLSASFINFCRFFMSCLPSATSLRTSCGSFRLTSIWPKMWSNWAFNSSCFLLPLN